MSELRLFFALIFSHDTLKKIASTITELRTFIPQGSIRWVKPGNIHLTLKFLGNVDSSRVSDLSSAMLIAARDISGCNAELQGLGAYPSLSHPRIIWLGMKPDEQMRQLFKNLENQLLPLGFPGEKRGFSPHITLARISDNISDIERTAIGKILNKIDIPLIASPSFDQFHLIKSDVDRSGPTYTKLHSLTFGR